MTFVNAFINWLMWTSLVALAMLVPLILWGWWLEMTDHRRASRRKAERIEHDYQETRRAMNDAAGQSWRNLVD